MDFILMETAVIYSALIKYIEFCESCRENPDNADQFIFIEKDIEMGKSLLKRVKEEHLRLGGDLTNLRA